MSENNQNSATVHVPRSNGREIQPTSAKAPKRLRPCSPLPDDVTTDSREGSEAECDSWEGILPYEPLGSCNPNSPSFIFQMPGSHGGGAREAYKPYLEYVRDGNTQTFELTGVKPAGEEYNDIPYNLYMATLYFGEDILTVRFRHTTCSVQVVRNDGETVCLSTMIFRLKPR